jgi:multicomponent Na+:H+ antiporter subunit D
MDSMPPVVIMLAAAALMVVLPQTLRRPIAIGAPALVLAYLALFLEVGDSWSFTWLSLDIEPLRVDKLSLAFGYVFGIAGALGAVYAWHLESRAQQTASLVYAGSSIGVVFAGDLISLILFWELMAVASAYLVWGGGWPKSQSAGARYLFVHMVGGSAVLGGILWHLGTGGSTDFTLFEGSIAGWLVLGGFAINAAIPPLHAWLADAYPEASITGSVFLSAFTTKTAIYVLARGFAGWEILLILGVVMALYGVVFAVLENDIRRLLAYHIVSQVGYMVAAVGMGTETAINGATAHAFAHVIYKGLLFMGVGAAIYATGGRRTLTELGGIGGRMRTVVTLYMIGAFAISAFPLFSGFTTKSMIIFAAEEQHIEWAVALLYVASVGTFLHTGLKLPYFTWFGPRRDDIHVGPVPKNMIVAMVGAAALCIGIGVYPQLLYDNLPFANHYDAYTADHVVTTLQLLAFTAVAFWLMLPKLSGERTITIDTDWFYRKATTPVRNLIQRPLEWPFAQAARGLNVVVRTITSIGVTPENAWSRLLRWKASPDVAISLLGRPPLGVALVGIFGLFAVVVLIAALTD